MEHSALIALHAQLRAAGPSGGRGGLGARGSHRAVVVAEGAELPRNALYARFVPAGSWNAAEDQVGVDYAGKRQTFDQGDDADAEAGDAAVAAAAPEDDAAARKERKRAKRERRAAAAEAEAAAAAAPPDRKRRRREEAAAEAAAEAVAVAELGDSLDAAVEALALQHLQQCLLVALSALCSGADGEAFASRRSAGKRAIALARDAAAAHPPRPAALRGAKLRKEHLLPLLPRAHIALVMAGSLECSEDGEAVRLLVQQ